MVCDLRVSGAQTYAGSDIRININDPCKIIAAGTPRTPGTQGQFYSSDGGATWGQTNLPLVLGDQSHAFTSGVDWTSDGTAWAITSGFVDVTASLRAYRSTDGGATWTFDGTPSGSGYTPEGAMWVDHSTTSPFKDNIYVIWSGLGSYVFVNRRTGPSGSWQTPIQLIGALGYNGDIKTNSSGDVFAFWSSVFDKELLVAKSTDGGVTFGTPVVIATTFAAFNVLVAVPAYDFVILASIFGGAYRSVTQNLVYAGWSDLSGGPGCNSSTPRIDITSTCKTRIWFSRSTDGGATWEPARMINNQPSLNDQFNPRLAVDESCGLLAAIYYDTVGDPGRLKTDVWMQSSFDSGMTWSAAEKVTSAPTDDAQYGTHNGLSGHCGVFFPSWTDRRGGQEEIWIAPIRTANFVELIASTV